MIGKAAKGLCDATSVVSKRARTGGDGTGEGRKCWGAGGSRVSEAQYNVTCLSVLWLPSSKPSDALW